MPRKAVTLVVDEPDRLWRWPSGRLAVWSRIGGGWYAARDLKRNAALREESGRIRVFLQAELAAGAVGAALPEVPDAR